MTRRVSCLDNIAGECRTGSEGWAKLARLGGDHSELDTSDTLPGTGRPADLGESSAAASTEKQLEKQRGPALASLSGWKAS